MVLIVIAVSGITQVHPVFAASSYRPHVPILIDGNTNFIASNGVTSGSGTSRDPFVIEGWSIAAEPGQPAVEIEHTTAFFTVRNVEALSGSTGVDLINADHGSILNSTLNLEEAVFIEGSRDITVSRNIVMNGEILVLDLGTLSTNLLIANNTLVDSTISVNSCPSCSQPTMMRISGNNIRNGGIDVSTLGATIEDNIVASRGTGILVGGSEFTITNNTLWTASYDIALDAIFSKLSGNIMTGLGISVGASSGGLSSQNDSPLSYDTDSIDRSNLVNGSPVFYYSRCASLNLANMVVGELFIASCSNVHVFNVTTVGNAGNGIFMAYVRHAELVHDHANGNCYGLMVTESSDVNVSESGFSGNSCYGNAVMITASANVTLANNIISENHSGLFEYNSTNTMISRNLFASNNFTGIRVLGGTNLVISQNRIQGNGGGIEVANVVDALIWGNWVSESQAAGISVLGANGLNITANTLIYNGAGISFRFFDPDTGPSYVYSTIVYHNNFVYNIADQADHVPGIVLTWDNGYPSGGNYWSDYTGSDNCSGVNQNVCGQPDGIGDTPYRGIVQLSLPYHYSSQSPLSDNYPLIKPYGDITQNTKAPYWPSGSTLTLTRVNSTSVLLQWSRASDVTWVVKYEISMNGKAIATLPGDVLSYAVSGLSPGSSYVFEIEAANPAGRTSTDGPTSAITIPATNPSGISPLTSAWWMQNPAWMFVAAAAAAVAATVIALARKRIAASRAR
jgi:parallel beta-helix repeat protein